MLTLLKDTWDRIQDDVKAKVGEAAYDSWLAQLRPLALERGTCYVEANNRMACDRVRRLYAPLLEDCLSANFGTRIAIHVTPAPESLLPDALEVSPTRPVVDASNNTAFLVLKSLLEKNPDLPSNLFLFHGPSGVGKSFLLRWWRDLANAPGRRRGAPVRDGLALRKAFQLKVRDRAMDELVAELTTDKPLLIDGVHRFSGHTRSQRELTKILVARADRLTLLTSRFSPRDIWKLAPDLQSVLSSGFVTEIDPPGHAARLAYLRALEGAASRNGRATAVEAMARDVRGSFTDLQRAWTLQRHGLDHQRHSDYFKLIDPGREFRVIRDRVAQRLEIPVEELLGKSQARRVTLARQALAWLAVQSGLSQAEVGRHMGARSRASISYCIKTIDKRMAESAEVRRIVEGLL